MGIAYGDPGSNVYGFWCDYHRGWYWVGLLCIVIGLAVLVAGCVVSALTTFLDGLIPRERTKRLRKTPVIMRLYSGGTCKVTHHVKVPVNMTRTKCVIAPRGGHISIRHQSFDGTWDLTRVTISLDTPALNKFEMPIDIGPSQKCPDRCNFTISPTHPGLLELNRDGWG